MIETVRKRIIRKPDGAASLIGLFCSRRPALLGLAGMAATLLAMSELAAGSITMKGTVRDRHRGTLVSAASVKIVDPSGGLLGTAITTTQGEWQIVIPVSGVEGGNEIPTTFAIEQNYPNPFNPSTKLPFTLHAGSRVRVTVHTILGQQLDAREYALRPGSYTIDWRAMGSAGVLLYSIEVGNTRLTRKMVQLDGGNAGGLGEALPSAFGGSARLTVASRVDSCRVITTSLAYEPDTTTVALADNSAISLFVDSVHDRAFVIDLHNDVIERVWGSNYTYQLADRHAYYHSDIPRFKDGGVDAQLFSIWVAVKDSTPSYFSTAMRYLDTLKAQASRNSRDLSLVVKTDSVDATVRRGKIAGIIMVEGGHSINDNIANLIAFYNAGVRMMTVTWNNSTSWAVSAQDSRADIVGLNEFGRQVIRTMDSLGMIIDVSHVGRKSVEDILATTKNPIIASHSGVYALRNHYRNLTDTQIKAIAQRGGVIGVVFYPTFLVPSGTARLENVMQHIDYIKNLVGVDYIALGSDFDGIETTPTGLEDVTKFPALTEALLVRGYSKAEVKKILGENFMRVFRSVCK